MKICSKCNIEKPLSAYHNNSGRTKDGKMAACKDCRNSYNRKKSGEIGHDVLYARYRDRNPELVREKARAYYIANAEKIKDNTTRNAKLDPELHAKRKAEEYARNKEQYLERSKKWVKENPEARAAVCKRYSQSKKNCPVYITTVASRKMVYRVLALTGARKKTKTETLIGYAREDLISHLESLFEDGMSWDNHGEWHIDHRVSIAELARLGVTDPSVINSLDNLQPLWAFDNLSKSDGFELAPSNIKQIKKRG